MRKNILRMTLAAAFVCAAGFTAYRAQAGAPTLSELALENVEALAGGETSSTMCVSAVNQWCEFVVITPNGNHVESHYNQKNKS